MLEAKAQDKIYNAFDANFLNSVDQYMDLSESEVSANTDILYRLFMARVAAIRAVNPSWSNLEIYWEASKGFIHTTLDIVGLIPVVGEAADLVNGAIYLFEGDMVNASLSAAAAIPFAGWAATGTKLAVKVVTVAGGGKALKIIAKTTREVTELAIKAGELVRQATLNKINAVTHSGVTSRITSEIAQTKLFAETVEEAADEIVDNSVRQNRIFSWDEIKQFFKRGNDFNKKAVNSEWYDFHEIHLANGKRLDSYDPISREIVSRKATDLGNIQFSTFENYLREMHQKYAAGTVIRSNKYPGIDGQVLQGQQILEIPLSNRSLSDIQTFVNFALNNYNIKIRFRPE